MSLFGSGLSAAVALRARILDRIGAEEEWTRTSEELSLIVWMSGPVATYFRVDHGAGDTPDLGILRIWTPVGAIGDLEAAWWQCDRLNRTATTSRWAVVPNSLDAPVLGATCAFVVGPHNVDALEGLALWCVREQVAVATAAVADGIASLVGPGGTGDPGEFQDAGAGRAGGTGAAPYGWGPFPGWELRRDEHEAVRHYEQYISPGRDASSVPLAEALLEAFGTLHDQMRKEGTGVWGRWKDAPVLTCEMPMSWDWYPGGRIAMTDEKAPPTALVDVSVDDHPRAGNGLRISLRLPWPPGPQALTELGLMNTLDMVVRGATHTIGAWSLEQRPAGEEDTRLSKALVPAYLYSVYLPAALADPALAGQDLDLPAIMREILLTLARQALLFLCRLGEPRAREDDSPYVGLAARAGDVPAHGLAWGETGEGGNPGALLLDHLYARCVGDGTDWADTRPDGFTWWPCEQAQHITSIPDDPASPRDGSVIRIATEVRNGVPVTAEAMAVIAGLNAELGRSVLVLGADGRLFLGCHLALADQGPWMRTWAHALASDQYATARDLLPRLDALGVPGEAGDLRAPVLRAAAGYRRTARHPGGAASPDPPRAHPAGAAARHGRPGDPAASGHGSRRRCGLHLAPVAPGHHPACLPGHPGLGQAGRHRIRARLGRAQPRAGGRRHRGQGPVVQRPERRPAGQPRHGRPARDRRLGPHPGRGVLPDHLAAAVHGHRPVQRGGAPLLGDHQGAVVTALRGSGPDAVTSQPLTPARLAAGLEELLESFGKVLEHPASYKWAVETQDAGVVVTMSGTLEDGGAGDAVPGAELAEADGAAFRTVVQVPVTGNRAELGLVYAAFLGKSLTRVQTPASYDLIPGEVARWSFTGGQVRRMVRQLTREGLISWPDGEPAGLFDAGPGQGRLTIGVTNPDRVYESAVLQVAGIVDAAALPSLPRGQARDIDLLGTWRQRDDGIAYEVTIPPAGQVWGTDRAATETLTWIARHVIRHVQAAIQSIQQGAPR